MSETTKANRERLAARQRRRRVIFNNDGCDCYCHDGRMTREGFLDARTSALADSHVDSIFYCTNKGGVGRFCHATKVAEPFTRRDGRYAGNVTPSFLEQGTDPLRVQTEWARAHGREIFWSLRMNDTHDGWGTPGDFGDDKISPVKRQHPEWLLGGKDRPVRFGCWTALNYELEPVRDFMVRLIEEVCRTYDVDGIECDFLRHETFFPSTAAGDPCSEAQCGLITALLRRVRGLLDEVAAARGKPLLLAVRTHDSIGLSREIGLDVEAWMAEGLVDLVTTSGYYRLVPWHEMARLGKRYGVPVYASLNESRLRDKDGAADQTRDAIESYRGRALNAWQDEASGICFFNVFNPALSLWREAGEPAALSRLNRIYHASVRSMGGALWRAPNVQRYRRLPILSPQKIAGCPILVRGELTEVPIDAGGSLAAAREIELRMRVSSLPEAGHVLARWNGRWLPAGAYRDGLLRFRLQPEEVKPLGNVAGLVLAGVAGPLWEDLQLWVAAEGTVEDMEKRVRAMVSEPWAG